MTTWLDERIDKIIDRLIVDNVEPEEELRKFASEIVGKVVPKLNTINNDDTEGCVIANCGFNASVKVALENANQAGIELEGKE